MILSRSTKDLTRNEPIEFLLALAGELLYFALCEWLAGATPGKLLLHLRVVTAGRTRCTLGGALSRGLVRYFDGILFGLVAYRAMR